MKNDWDHAFGAWMKSRIVKLSQIARFHHARVHNQSPVIDYDDILVQSLKGLQEMLLAHKKPISIFLTDEPLYMFIPIARNKSIEWARSKKWQPEQKRIEECLEQGLHGYRIEAPPQDLDWERVRYVATRLALDLLKDDRARALALQHSIPTRSVAEFEEFIQKYPDGLPVKEIRECLGKWTQSNTYQELSHARENFAHNLEFLPKLRLGINNRDWCIYKTYAIGAEVTLEELDQTMMLLSQKFSLDAEAIVSIIVQVRATLRAQLETLSRQRKSEEVPPGRAPEKRRIRWSELAILDEDVIDES